MPRASPLSLAARLHIRPATTRPYAREEAGLSPTQGSASLPCYITWNEQGLPTCPLSPGHLSHHPQVTLWSRTLSCVPRHTLLAATPALGASPSPTSGSVGGAAHHSGLSTQQPLPEDLCPVPGLCSTRRQLESSLPAPLPPLGISAQQQQQPESHCTPRPPPPGITRKQVEAHVFGRERNQLGGRENGGRE